MKPKHVRAGRAAPDEQQGVSPIRASLARLPRWLQYLITWLTGEALPGQSPLLPNSPAIQIAVAALTLIGGIGLGMLTGSNIIFIDISYA